MRQEDDLELEALGAVVREQVDASSLRLGVEAVFEVSGLTDLVTPSAKDCGWQK